MNALSTTYADFAAAMIGRRRTAHTVHVVKTTHGGFEPRILVLVVPDGQECGEYFEVRQRTLDALRAGETPAELELEPVDDYGDADDDASGIPSPDSLRRWHEGRVL
jgi:hypothetical protein